MRYINEIYKKINLVNEVLTEINAPHLLENQFFLIDEMSMDSWLKIDLVAGKYKHISLGFIFSSTEFKISLDKVVEAIDWRNDYIIHSPEEIKIVLKRIFTSYILVEYYGLSRTQITLFGKDGESTNNFKYYEGFPIGWKRKCKLCMPIYSV